MNRTCQNPHCNKVFDAKPADVKRGWAKCCSKSCAAWKREKKKGGQIFDSKGHRLPRAAQLSENDRINDIGRDCQEFVERGY